MVKKFEDPTAVKRKVKGVSYNERSSNFVSMGSEYGAGTNAHVGMTGRPKRDATSDIPQGAFRMDVKDVL